MLPHQGVGAAQAAEVRRIQMAPPYKNPDFVMLGRVHTRRHPRRPHSNIRHTSQRVGSLPGCPTSFRKCTPGRITDERPDVRVQQRTRGKPRRSGTSFASAVGLDMGDGSEGRGAAGVAVDERDSRWNSSATSQIVREHVIEDIYIGTRQPSKQ